MLAWEFRAPFESDSESGAGVSQADLRGIWMQPERRVNLKAARKRVTTAT